MATALPSNSDPECSICIDRYKNPKILSCGHSFCHDCLERWIAGRKGTFPCPICKQDVNIPQGGVGKFPTNFVLNTSTDSPRISDISTIQPSTSLKLKHYCPNHSKKEVAYYCQTCNLGLCFRCIFKDHHDHKILDLESDSTRDIVVQELSKSEQLIQSKIEDLEKIHAALLKTSEKLNSFCTKNIADEKDEGRQKEIKRHFDMNESKLTETQQNVITQIENIKTDLDKSHPTTEKPTFTLIYSLIKLKQIQKHNIKTEIPLVTYVKWTGLGMKVWNIFNCPTDTKPSGEGSEGRPSEERFFKSFIPPGIVMIFKFNHNGIKIKDTWYHSKDKYTSHDVVWGCRVLRDNYLNRLYIGIVSLHKDNPRIKCCDIEYTLTILNKEKDKNEISETMTERFIPHVVPWKGLIHLPWNKLTDKSEGFINMGGQFFVRFDLLLLLDIEYN